MRNKARMTAVLLALIVCVGALTSPAAATPEGQGWFLLDKDVSTETFINPCTGLEHEVTFDYEDWVKGTPDAYVLQSWWSIETSDGYRAPFKHVYQETYNALGGALTFNVAVHNTNVNEAGERFSIHVRLHVTVSATGVERVIDEASFTCLGSSG